MATVFDQGGGVKDSIVRAANEPSGQVGAVVDGEQAPTVRYDNIARSADIRGSGGVEPVIVSTGAVDHVPGSCGIVGDLLSDVVGNGGVALVEVFVAVEHEVDAVLDQDGLEGSLALSANRRANVPGTVASCNNPGCLLAVDSGEILLQPGKLGSGRSKGASILVALTTRLVRSVREVGLSIEHDEVHTTVVEGVPEVLEATRFSRGHAGWKVSLEYMSHA